MDLKTKIENRISQLEKDEDKHKSTGREEYANMCKMIRWELRDLITEGETSESNCNIPLVSSCISVGDEVLYVGSYVGKVINESDVRLKDGTVVCSLRSQPQKFRKII